jgi:hypothetical protein
MMPPPCSTRGGDHDAPCTGLIYERAFELLRLTCSVTELADDGGEPLR